MARRRLSVRLGWAVLGLALGLLLLVSLYLAANAEGLGQRYASAYPWVFALAALSLLALAIAIVSRLWRLWRDVRAGVAGARLRRRLLAFLLLLALPPLALVYAFGVRFVAATVDTWMTANTPAALDEALALGRQYLDDRLRAAETETRALAESLRGLPEAEIAAAIESAIDAGSARQFAVYSSDGRLRAIAASDPRALVSAPPGEAMRVQLFARGHYAETEVENDALRLRVLLPIEGGGRGRILQGLFALPEGYAQRLQRIEQHAAAARRAVFLREALKIAFQLILTLVLLVSALLAILLAFDVARRIVAPVARLAAATRAVGEGRFDARVPEVGDDELAFLAKSFNRMVDELDRSRGEARRSSEETERQRAFLETVLARLSSGVLVLDGDACLRSANAAAATLLECDLAARVGAALDAPGASPALAVLAARVATRRAEGVREFREEVSLGAEAGGRQFLLRGARLPDAGWVLVFDDTTAIDRARRDAAWGEVAQRLAHEVKNPLTPIQLAAERLRRRVMPRLDAGEAEVVDRATHTIVAQVDALKTLVNAFGDYARTPQLTRGAVDLGTLVGDVVELYQGDPRCAVVANVAPDLPRVDADAGRLRQVLHNLIKNAQEAGAERTALRIEVCAAERQDGGQRFVELAVADDGPGLPEGFDASWFEPYRSTKAKGTGLGLAIVRKIAEEHGGTLAAEPNPGGGARFSLRLPR